MRSQPDIDEALFEELWALAGEIKANMPEDVTSDHSWLHEGGELPVRAPSTAPRQRPAAEIDAEVAQMLRTGQEIRAHMTGPVSSDLSDPYGEDGLPL